MAVETDELGNIRATRWGSHPHRPPVVIGSHLDTVPSGGGYDGTLGVAAGVGAVVDVASRCSDHTHPLQVMVFSGEESSRFGVSNIGSKMATGFMKLGDLFRYRDEAGISLFRAMRDFGLSPEWHSRVRILPTEMKAFFELHIEQGPVLDRSEIDVGVVEAIAAPTRLLLDVQGEAGHSGACPMEDRRDALSASAELVLEVERLGLEEATHRTVATVGDCEVTPGVMNVIPGRCGLKVDIRGIDRQSIDRVRDGLLDYIQSLEKRRAVRIYVEELSRGVPVILDGGLRSLLGRVCDDLRIPWKSMPSGAGHDAMYVASVIPTAMIFVPCVGGVSHSSLERIDVGRIRSGYMALVEAVYRLVSRERYLDKEEKS